MRCGREGLLIIRFAADVSGGERVVMRLYCTAAKCGYAVCFSWGISLYVATHSCGCKFDLLSTEKLSKSECCES